MTMIFGSWNQPFLVEPIWWNHAPLGGNQCFFEGMIDSCTDDVNGLDWRYHPHLLLDVSRNDVTINGGCLRTASLELVTVVGNALELVIFPRLIAAHQPFMNGQEPELEASSSVIGHHEFEPCCMSNLWTTGRWTSIPMGVPLRSIVYSSSLIVIISRSQP